MPRVKIDYVVSFSSEDPESPAASLLAREAGRARWLCARGAAHASVVLQLARACAISSVTIGAHQAALVEVLVGRSETPSKPYQVLVPSSVFLGPRESRGGGGGAGAERVRTFAREALAAGARDQRWDRVRLVATQPYNKHCKYGISFVHLFEPEQAPPPPAPPLEEEEEEDAFRPGELFAQHRRAAAATSDTGAQIRQASSQALRSEPEAAAPPPPPPARDPPRAGLRAGTTSTVYHNQRTGLDKTPTKEKQTSSKTLQNNIDGDRKDNGKKVTPRTNDALSRRDENRKRSHSDKNDKKPQAREDADTCGEGGEGGGARPLHGVVFVLSGYENPRRARLRELGAALGARPRRAWGPGCTHLVCAFPNTPKLRAVRAAADGARVPAVRGEWLEACARAARRLPWRAHATDPAQRTPADHTSECDTGDEIEEVLRQQKRRRAAPSPCAPRAAVEGEPSDEDGVQSAADGGMQGDVAAESDSCDTEEEEAPECGAGGGAARGAVPAALGALAFVVCACGAAPLDARLVARYARAYGGLLLTSEEAESRAAPYYVLCGGGCGARGARLRADWLWACHAARALVPAAAYLLPPPDAAAD